MRFERVDARAFGPFVARSLELAPGLNVVFGPNEGGKSSWHAALYAGLCGMRRARGQVADDKAFRERHRPWSGERWEVGVVVRLADGRRAELRRDLDARVATVRDLDLGRDLAGEIINDGSPDGALWLGLDRGSFLSTVCVRQAELALLHDDAQSLQDQLQRAAASMRDSDTSAASALTRLRAFRAEQVGQDRVGARRPLRLARERQQSARERLEDARRRHAELDRETQALGALQREDLEGAGAEVRLQALAAERHARAAEAVLERARSLDARHPASSEAPLDGAHEQLASVLAAVVGFESLDEPAPLEGESAAQLAARLVALGPSEGDREVHPSVSQHARVFDAAQLARERAGDARPELREQLTLALEGRRRVRRALVVGAALALLVSGLLVLVEVWIAAAAAGALGIVAGLAAALRSDASVSLGLARAEEQLEHQIRLDREVERAAAALATALAARGAPVLASVGEALLAYRDACAERSRADDERDELERAVPPRERREREHAQREATRATAAQRVLECGRACGIPHDDPGAVARALRAWHAARMAELPARDTEIRERAELAALLAGQDVEALARRAGEARAQVAALGASASADDARPDEDLAYALSVARARARASREERVALEVRLAERRSALPPVAEAEEELARAEAELLRVSDLFEVLEQTETFLERAQETAHRSIAPRLAKDLRAHLPSLTCGRWLDVSVDPASLGVQLTGSDGVWRPLAQLSHGTREQVWLLLRVALARHLVREGETSPLLLDDVTVHFDADRTSAALEALHRVARERQIVLFTQEEQVRAWARAKLRPPDDRLIELPPV